MKLVYSKRTFRKRFSNFEMRKSDYHRCVRLSDGGSDTATESDTRLKLKSFWYESSEVRSLKSMTHFRNQDLQMSCHKWRSKSSSSLLRFVRFRKHPSPRNKWRRSENKIIINVVSCSVKILYEKFS